MSDLSRAYSSWTPELQEYPRVAEGERQEVNSKLVQVYERETNKPLMSALNAMKCIINSTQLFIADIDSRFFVLNEETSRLKDLKGAIKNYIGTETTMGLFEKVIVERQSLMNLKEHCQQVRTYFTAQETVSEAQKEAITLVCDVGTAALADYGKLSIAISEITAYEAFLEGRISLLGTNILAAGAQVEKLRHLLDPSSAPLSTGWLGTVVPQTYLNHWQSVRQSAVLAAAGKEAAEKLAAAAPTVTETIVRVGEAPALAAAAAPVVAAVGEGPTEATALAAAAAPVVVAVGAVT